MATTKRRAKTVRTAKDEELLEELRRRGFAVCVWHGDDVWAQCGCDDRKAGDWLAGHRDEIEKAMIKAGYDVIVSYFPEK